MVAHEAQKMRGVESYMRSYQCVIRGKPSTRHYRMNILTCPMCGHTIHRNANATRHIRFYCDGVKTTVKREER